MTFQLQMGRVKWFDVKEGYGFISPVNGGQDIYVNRRAIANTKISGLKKASVLNFQLRVTLMVLLLLMLSLMNFKPSSAANLSKN